MRESEMVEQLKELNKEVEVGLVALIAVARQIRDEKTGDPNAEELFDAKRLLGKVRQQLSF